MSASLQALEQEIITCRKCPRLVAWREEVARIKRKAYQDQTYWGKPVPGFGDSDARIIVVGLAPGAHGSNRTGRMFTGDDGTFMFCTAGFANQTESSQRDDGPALQDVFITAVCRRAAPRTNPLLKKLKIAFLAAG